MSIYKVSHLILSQEFAMLVFIAVDIQPLLFLFLRKSLLWRSNVMLPIISPQSPVCQLESVTCIN